jgi:hypothetical protein
MKAHNLLTGVVLLALHACAYAYEPGVSFNFDDPDPCPGQKVMANMVPLGSKMAPGGTSMIEATIDVTIQDVTQGGPEIPVYHGSNRVPFTFDVPATAAPGDQLGVSFRATMGSKVYHGTQNCYVTKCQ